MKKILSFAVALVIVAGAVWAVFFRGQQGNADTARVVTSVPPVPVIAVPVTRTPTPVIVRANGTAQPDATVSLKTRISGQISKVWVSDSADVTAGQVLFSLDDRAQQVAVQQAQAAIARDQANLIAAQSNFDRLSKLPPDEVVSRQSLDNARSAAEAAQAAIKGDQATLATAQLQLSYDTITAPIDGRLGFIALKVGNLVNTTDTNPMVVINRIHPIQVAFNVPQRYIGDIQSLATAGQLPVNVDTAGGTVQGHLAYMDNAVDPTTGTIQLRGIFDNQDDKLWPGELVSLSLTLRTDPNALVVPDQSVQQSQSGPVVWVVGAGNTAQMTPVTVDRSVGGKSVISSGVKAGDMVVTDGIFRLSPGSRVVIRQSGDNGGKQTASAEGTGATP